MTQQLQPGIYFDNTRGWHISALVVELALENGWKPRYEAEEYRRAIAILKARGVDEFEEYVSQHEDTLQWLESDATEYIRANLVPEGCWCDYSDGFGDWGVWEEEEDG